MVLLELLRKIRVSLPSVMENGLNELVRLNAPDKLYSSGERPLDACPEVIGLSRFSAFVIRPIEELADRTGARCEGPPSG